MFPSVYHHKINFTNCDKLTTNLAASMSKDNLSVPSHKHNFKDFHNDSILNILTQLAVKNKRVVLLKSSSMNMAIIPLTQKKNIPTGI